MVQWGKRDNFIKLVQHIHALFIENFTRLPQTRLKGRFTEFWKIRAEDKFF